MVLHFGYLEALHNVIICVGGDLCFLFLQFQLLASRGQLRSLITPWAFCALCCFLTGHPGFWLCPQGPRAAQAKTFREETHPRSRPHSGRYKKVHGNINMYRFIELMMISVFGLLTKSWNHVCISSSRLLGGFMLPTSLAQICCALGIFTRRLYLFQCTGKRQCFHSIQHLR